VGVPEKLEELALWLYKNREIYYGGSARKRKISRIVMPYKRGSYHSDWSRKRRITVWLCTRTV
jgi:3-hydroxymyristoyl/3-hydroxydecanoyl-(acyl carrier protein) dehydratase